MSAEINKLLEQTVRPEIDVAQVLIEVPGSKEQLAADGMTNERTRPRQVLEMLGEIDPEYKDRLVVRFEFVGTGNGGGLGEENRVFLLWYGEYLEAAKNTNVESKLFSDMEYGQFRPTGMMLIDDSPENHQRRDQFFYNNSQELKKAGWVRGNFAAKYYQKVQNN